MLFGKILTINSPFNLRNIRGIEQVAFYELFFYNFCCYAILTVFYLYSMSCFSKI